MRSNAAIKFEEVEVGEEINQEEIHEIEDLFSQILFDAWLANRGASLIANSTKERS